jgi:hypothetical protein
VGNQRLTARPTATLADDTEIVATHEEPSIASIKLQAIINKIDDWANKWRTEVNQNKSTHILLAAESNLSDSANGQ